MDAYENFNRAPPEKQRAVLGAGFSCFARDGYKKTAMSEIAKTAGVSKAALFHYFGSKHALYQHLFHFSCRAIGSNVTPGGEDFFECIAHGIEIKTRTIAEYPGMYEFLLSATRESGEISAEILREANAHFITARAQTLFANVHWAKLKASVTPEEALAMVRWISDGYLRENAWRTREEIVAGIRRYLDLLKTAIYKEEWQ
ncbi:MAG: TetR/AcrR family transcriptional regulator [Oscillospiraceae bacterium]|nr:TetR/AcrR family transcriptional regulator [Oscillospiraceae bacterium]